MNFISIKKYKVKKITTNVFIPILLGAIMLIGNTISITGYNFNIPKSFAKEIPITSSNNLNPLQNSPFHHTTVHSHGPGQFSNLQNSPFHHTTVHSHGPGQISNNNLNPLQNSPLHNTILHNAGQSIVNIHPRAGQSVANIDPTAMTVPFSGTGINNGKLSNTSTVIVNSNNPLCNVISQTSFNNSAVSKSFCNDRTHHPVFSFTRSLSKSADLHLDHQDTRFKVVGPDNFKFINSYWTTSETPRLIDSGISANNTFIGAGSATINPEIETDINKGPVTLAIGLQYEGVVELSGVTAAIKLPTGFESNLPLIHNTNRHDISFSAYRGDIFPGQGIVLYFSVKILKGATLNPYVVTTGIALS